VRGSVAAASEVPQQLRPFLEPQTGSQTLRERGQVWGQADLESARRQGDEGVTLLPCDRRDWLSCAGGERQSNPQ